MSQSVQNRLPIALLILLAPALQLACQAPAYERSDSGIVVALETGKPGDARLLRLQVMAPDLIRVTATADEAFSDRPSLILDEAAQPATTGWEVAEAGDEVILRTERLEARVDRRTGAVSFFDAAGNRLLAEKPEGGKTFTPAEVLGERCYHVRQVFDSPPDEAFYGLGQHQHGLMNYKGRDVDLWQYNIVAVVPFLVSSRNYGILWDNYSRTKFGDPRNYESLDGVTLYGEDGEAGGLTAQYYQDEKFGKLLLSRSESRIEHQFIDVNDPYPDGFDVNRGSIRWVGEIEPRESGEYKFRLYVSSYIKVWFDSELVADGWRQNWLPWTHVWRRTLEAGRRYPIRIEWIPQGGFIGFQCLPPDPSFNPQDLSLYSEVADQIDYYFVAGRNLNEVIAGYRRLTGTAPLMPKWAMGLFQSRERYRTQQEVLDTVREFRKRGIPLDVIVQDWFYWEEDKWGDHEFDRSRFPDPAGMVRELHEELNARIMISVWPKFYVGTKNFEAFKERGWLYMRNVEKNQHDWVGYVSTFYDPYSEGARKLFWRQVDEKLGVLGMDAWWMDATEPDIQSNLSDEERILRMHPTALGSGARYLNTYSLMQAKAVYEGQRESYPDRRVFILTRSAFAGQQRYSAATWSGDIAARWHDLAMQIPAGLNFSLSGLPYWTMDIGGFAVESRFQNAKGRDLDEWRELMTRWFQFGAFCPLFRVHGQFPYREMYNVAPPDHPAYQSMLKYDRLRYRLLPYVYSLAGRVTHEHDTIMRALVLDFPEDAKVREIGDQYLFGPALLVSPVTQYQARSRSVYLPAGAAWYDFHTGEFREGGQTLDAAAPYGDLPLFVRAGSLVPFGPAVQSALERPADPLRIVVYTGADAAFRIYEDDGLSNGYEKGQFAWIPLRWQEATGTLIVGPTEGSFPGMKTDRRLEIVVVTPSRPRGEPHEGDPDRTADYSGAELRLDLSDLVVNP
ncbi:MAG: glycoside hydrolase family 31 protein [Acidobacteriota bacterium]